MKRALFLVAILVISMMACAQTRETAVLFSGVNMDNSYLLSNNVSVTFDSEGKGTIYLGTAKVSDLDITNKVKIEFKDAFKLTANQDPIHTENYYATFFTSERAYQVPEMVTAYVGVVEGNVLKMTSIGDTIHKSEPVILKATGSSIVLMPSARQQTGSIPNVLEGTDETKTLSANQYALSYGSNGVGFYLWEGLPIDANKAYLTLPSDAKALTFDFDDGTTGINNHQASSINHQPLKYNLNGQKVESLRSGQIYIMNGKKYIAK